MIDQEILGSYFSERPSPSCLVLPEHALLLTGRLQYPAAGGLLGPVEDCRIVATDRGCKEGRWQLVADASISSVEMIMTGSGSRIPEDVDVSANLWLILPAPCVVTGGLFCHRSFENHTTGKHT